MSDSEDRTIIKKYLLGEITGEEQLQEIEERVFTDEKYYEELLRIEAELTDQYAGGELTAGEREKVETVFLSTRERRRDLSFALAVREYLNRTPGRAEGVDPQSGGGSTSKPDAPRNNVRRFKGGKSFLSSAPFKIAASVFIMFALGGVWRAFFYRSDLDRGVLALKETYQAQRPTETRISMLDYAPPPNQRGGPDRVNSAAKGRAGRFLQYAVEDAPSADSFHTFGNHLLAARQFDDALAQFAEAEKLDPNNAELQNDIGVAWLEKARATRPDEEAGEAYAEAATGLKRFEKALELDGSLPDALFNRALALEALKSWEEAREAWEKYLEQDSSSEWAKEARRHLDDLNTRRQGRNSQSREQILDEFLAARRLGDDSRAWQIISRNREAITGRLVFALLTDAYLDFSLKGRGDEARDVLQALHYAGDLESKNTGDNYTAELARFYGRAPPDRLPLLSQAHEHMRQGYKSCQEANFSDAAGLFEKARALFESAGDELEIYFSEYWIGYSYHVKTHSEEALAVLRSLIRVCKARGYKWLLAQALNASANIQTVLNNYSEGIAETDQSLALSLALGDSYTVQKNLAQLADKYNKLGDRRQMTLKYLGQCLEQSELTWPGARQMWRNYDTAANVFESLGLDQAALAYRKESFRLSLAEQDPSLIYVSLIHLARAYSRLRKHEEGIELALRGLDIVRNLPDPLVGEKINAYCLLQLGELYREAGDLARAIESYGQSIRIYDRLKFQPFSYDAHKGKLLCHFALGDDAASERELQTALRLIEENRKKIREEQNRNSYYDKEQTIYDMAADFAYTRRDAPRRAFEYSETSRARTLLDLMRGAPRRADGGEEPITVPAVSPPLTLVEIQQRMPERVQLLKYTVLPDKVIIWLVRRDGFEAREKKVAAAELDRLTRRYLDLISTQSKGRDGEMREAAVALYDILFKPVEPLLDREQPLCVVPDKLLNHLPFSALVSPTTGRYLIADYPLLFSPSSSIFVAASEAARARASQAPETLLSVGGPTFDREAFPLPDLPAAVREAREVRQYYDEGTCLVGPAASKENVTREMESADVLHFASHYVVDEKSPMASKLLLAKSDGAGEGKSANGVLRVYDLYRMRLPRTRLVVLAACQTGVERYYKGEGMIGMSRAFIAAGVPSVVASHWPVNSDATAELMVNFHRHRKHGGLSTAQALRRAQLDMLEAHDQRYQHPYYWAAFVLIGGYSASY